MTKRPELKPYLLNWLNENEGWHPKVDLYRVGHEIEFSAESVGRALRELAELGKIKDDKYNGKWVKGLKRYASLGTEKPVVKKPQIIIKPDGTPVAVF